MKSIKWVGEYRMIPGYGVGTAGRVFEVPTKDADSFVKQGLAVYEIKTVKKTTKKEIEQ